MLRLRAGFASPPVCVHGRGQRAGLRGGLRRFICFLFNKSRWKGGRCARARSVFCGDLPESGGCTSGRCDPPALRAVRCRKWCGCAAAAPLRALKFSSGEVNGDEPLLEMCPVGFFFGLRPLFFLATQGMRNALPCRAVASGEGGMGGGNGKCRGVWCFPCTVKSVLPSAGFGGQLAPRNPGGSFSLLGWLLHAGKLRHRVVQGQAGDSSRDSPCFSCSAFSRQPCREQVSRELSADAAAAPGWLGEGGVVLGAPEPNYGDMGAPRAHGGTAMGLSLGAGIPAAGVRGGRKGTVPNGMRLP